MCLQPLDARLPRRYARATMLGLLRIALLVATFFLLLGVVMAVGSGTTGAA